MAVYNVDKETGEIWEMTPAQIKTEIQERTGWDTSTYQKEYYKLRNRLRNYETVVGAKKPAAVNEEMLRILRNRQDPDAELTGRQKAILEFSTAGAKGYRARAEAGRIPEAAEELAKNSLIEGTFQGLLKKSATARKAYNKWLNQTVRTRTETLPDGTKKRIRIKRKDTVTAAEINRFLGGQAKDLHSRQKAEYDAAKAYYQSKGGRRAVGSD